VTPFHKRILLCRTCKSTEGNTFYFPPGCHHS